MGTVALRAAVHDAEDGSLLAAATQKLPTHRRGPTRELDPAAAWDALEIALAQIGHQLEAANHLTRVESIAAACTASTILSTDPTLRPLGRAILWSDHRAAAEAEATRATAHRVLGRTLGHVSPEWGLPKFTHIVRAASPTGRRASPARVVELLDWLNWKLSGRLVANAGIREWGWCAGDDGRVPQDLAASLGIAEDLAMLPDEVLETGHPLGEVQTDLVGRHAFLAGATVLMGGMDSFLAGLGQGVTISGRAALSYGSSSSFLAGTDLGDAGGHLYGPFTRILPGSLGYWHGGQSTAGLAVSWLLDILRTDRDELERDATAVAAGSDGLVFRETFLDRRNPDPQSPLRALWDGLALPHGPAHLYRSVLEAVAMGTRWALEPLRPREVIVGGGLATSRLFVTILADVLGSEIRLLRHDQPAAFGAAFVDDASHAARLNGIVATVLPTGADYERAFVHYRGLHGLPAELSGPRPVTTAVA